MFGSDKRLRRRLDSDGRRATAQVIACKCTLTNFKGSDAFPTDVKCHCRLELQVMPEGEPAFHVRTHAVIPDNPLSTGATVPVLYDPGDHEQIVVLTDEMSRDVSVTFVHQRADGSLGAISPHDNPVAEGSITINGQTISTGRSAAPATDTADEIKKLADLRAQGILTDAEFQAQKTKLLDRM